MPPKFKSRKRAAETEEYGSDGGFVEDAPMSKRSKPSKTPPTKDVQKDADGNEFWKLSEKRRVAVSEFKKAQLINIREYYEKDGKTLPGSKGISLSVDQFNALIEVLPQIESALKSKGESVSRPNYDDPEPTPTTVKPTASAIKDEDEDEGEAQEAEQFEADGPAEVQKPSSRLDKFKYTKKNHEATSDEED